jgi:cytochrome c-type biogenesis protein
MASRQAPRCLHGGLTHTNPCPRSRVNSSPPVLATILTAASTTATVGWGAFLLACYSIGLGIPFVFLAIGFQRARGALEWLRRNGRRVEIIGGVMFVFVGALFVTGEWAGIFLPLQRSFARWGWPPV